MKKLILTFLFSFISVAAVLAQGGPPNPPGPVDDVPVPIDHHIWLAFLMGLAFGLYLLLSKKSVFRD